MEYVPSWGVAIWKAICNLKPCFFYISLHPGEVKHVSKHTFYGVCAILGFRTESAWTIQFCTQSSHFLSAPKMVGARTQTDTNALVKKPLRMPISNAFFPVPTSSSRVKWWHSQPANWERKLWLHHIIWERKKKLVLDSKRHGLSTLGAGPAAIGPTWLLSNLQQLAGGSW